MSYEVAFPRDKKSNFSKIIFDKLSSIIHENISSDEADLISYSKDYMPITLRWLIDGKIAALPDAVVWPESTEQVSKILILANKEKIPIVPFGAGSGVLGGAIPVKGGIVVDLKKMDHIHEIDDLSLVAKVETGINGMILERNLNREGYTMGHIPQSLYCSTLGGWIACKAAGQFSTKYGKIEDIIISLKGVLADGTIISSKPVPRTSTGPSVERLLLGSEGTLGIITEASVKIWPYPEKKILASFLFPDLNSSLESVRKIMRKNLYPAVIRIYDENETLRHFYDIGDVKGKCMLVLVMEGTEKLADLENKESDEICKKHNGVSMGEEPVKHWLNTRFNVKESSDFTPKGFIFDTIEVSVGWRYASELYEGIINAMRSIKGVVVASAHASHFYPQGVCFYFTFGGVPPKKIDPFDFYKSIWDEMMKACIENNGSISHHHGIGMLRANWLEKEMGNRFKLFNSIKHLVDPNNIMNPGKMGVNKY